MVDYYPEQDLKFVTGDYFKMRILIEDADPDSPDPENPVMVPRNLTGWTARAHIRKDTKRETDILATFEVTVGETDPTDGFLVLELLEEESEKCIIKGGWDLELSDPDGKPDTILGGKVIPRLDYTR